MALHLIEIGELVTGSPPVVVSLKWIKNRDAKIVVRTGERGGGRLLHEFPIDAAVVHIPTAVAVIADLLRPAYRVRLHASVSALAGSGDD